MKGLPTDMKTTVHVTRPETATVPAATVRLAAWMSGVAAVAAVIVRTVTDVPQTAVVLAVIVVGFSLSWHTTGRADNG